ncbi:ABC transporter substrate-binding protein [Aerococcaceae bacterium INB8]|uniref:ABC transporter substrate-binding protein n=1 Tax=Ruoffia halotolerans TaxID=2748684 RepID=A0A839A4H8_9LACT|nr:ABC transporter substrate-binding protein [Ruoffia halotolerans]MBA5728907.1 ABC transporter substrate-binding protein [Ruoffia halotolerans]
MKLRKMGLTLLSMLTLGAILTPAMSTANAQEQEPIRIGANLELSGYGSAYGVPIIDNLTLAAEEINEAGGLLDGRTIEIIDYDNTSNKTEATSIATRLAGEDVVAVLGPATSDMIYASRPSAIQSQLPTMYPVGTSDDLTIDENGEVISNIFRLAFTYSFQGKAAARYAMDELSATNAAVITDQSNDYSVGLADPFKAEFEALGGTITEELFYNAGEQDFMGLLTSLAALDFDVLYIPGFFSEGGIIVRQAREMGLMQPILSGHGFASDTLLEIAGPQNVTELYITSHFHTGSENPGAQEYVAKFEERYGESPDTFDALSYDAAHLIFQAIEEAGTDDPEAIRESMENIQFEGITGAFQYDEYHNAVETAPMLHYIDGEVAEVFEVNGN